MLPRGSLEPPEQTLPQLGTRREKGVYSLMHAVLTVPANSTVNYREARRRLFEEISSLHARAVFTPCLYHSGGSDRR